MAEDLIEVRHLNKTFSEQVAVEDLNLVVKAGEIYGLVGPDGAGKTTSIRLLCGALKPSQSPGGEAPKIRIAGFDMLKDIEKARAQIGYLPQRFSLYEEMTVIENLRFFAEVRGLPTSKWQPRCMEILSFVSLDAFVDRRAGQLSGGMKQKLGLAAALVHQPRVLLLDEPTTGVDPVTRQDFWQLIIRLAAQNDHPEGCTAVLVSTPYMDEASRCTRVGFMRKGRLTVEGSPNQLRAQLAGRILELMGSPLPLLRRIAVKDADVQNAQLFGDSLHLRVKEGCSVQVIQRVTEDVAEQGGVVTRFRLVEPQLEDVFMGLIERD